MLCKWIWYWYIPRHPYTPPDTIQTPSRHHPGTTRHHPDTSIHNPYPPAQTLPFLCKKRALEEKAISENYDLIQICANSFCINLWGVFGMCLGPGGVMVVSNGFWIGLGMFDTKLLAKVYIKWRYTDIAFSFKAFHCVRTPLYGGVWI